MLILVLLLGTERGIILPPTVSTHGCASRTFCIILRFHLESIADGISQGVSGGRPYGGPPGVLHRVDTLTRRYTRGKRHDQNLRVREAISQPVRRRRYVRARYRTRFRPNKVD